MTTVTDGMILNHKVYTYFEYDRLTANVMSYLRFFMQSGNPSCPKKTRIGGIITFCRLFMQNDWRIFNAAMHLVRRDVARYLAGNDHITYRFRRCVCLQTDRYSGAESCILCSSSGRCMGFIWSKFTLYMFMAVRNRYASSSPRTFAGCNYYCFWY
jgi:hypothetical protein